MESCILFDISELEDNELCNTNTLQKSPSSLSSQFNSIQQIPTIEDKNNGENEYSSPHADKDVSVTEDEEEDVLLSDVVEVSALFVGEEQVGFPQAFEHLGVNGEGIRLEVLR